MIVVKSVMKTVVLMVMKIEPISAGNKAWDDYRIIEYLNCTPDLNFEVDFGVNGTIGVIVTKWELILFG